MPYYPPPSAGGGGYNLIQDEGSSVAVRTTIDFVGAGVSVTDVAGETQVSIAGGGAGTFDYGLSYATSGGYSNP